MSDLNKGFVNELLGTGDPNSNKGFVNEILQTANHTSLTDDDLGKIDNPANELSPDQEWNIGITEILLEKYPTVMQVIILEDQTKVAYFDTQEIFSTCPEDIKGIVAFSPYGLTFIPEGEYYLNTGIIESAINIVSSQEPIAESLKGTKIFKLIAVTNISDDRVSLSFKHYPQSFDSQDLHPALRHQLLGQRLQEANENIKPKRTSLEEIKSGMA